MLRGDVCGDSCREKLRCIGGAKDSFAVDLSLMDEVTSCAPLRTLEAGPGEEAATDGEGTEEEEDMVKTRLSSTSSSMTTDEQVASTQQTQDLAVSSSSDIASSIDTSAAYCVTDLR
jgi:hypothetical protein